jgi:hypothetical protein
MESGQRVSRTGRKLGSSRRRQIREPADDKDAPVAPEPEFWSPQAAAELQDFFQDCGAKERGYVTREDLAVSLRPQPTPYPSKAGLTCPSAFSSWTIHFQKRLDICLY